MSTYVLIHGAGSDSWYWHLVAPPLRERGHDVITVDLPSDDDAAGLAEYTDVVVDAIGDRTHVVLVAQSLAGFVAPLVCERVPVDLMVLVAAMVPSPGESPGDWWANTGWEQAKREHAVREGRDDTDDPVTLFLHDLPPDLKAAAMTKARNQSGAPFEKPWPLAAWPEVPTEFLLCRDDRFFPAEFQRRVVHERLGITPDEMDGGHLPALAHPNDLVERLEAYRIAHDHERSDAMTRTTEPTEEIDARYSSDDANATPWREARRALEDAGVYWLSTVRPDGRPHVTTLLSVWLDDALYFCTGAEERKAKNLAQNPQCMLTTGCNTLEDGLDVVVEGEARNVRDDGRLQRIADAYEAKYGPDWHFDVHDGRFHHGAGAALVYEVTPTTAFGFRKGEPSSQTRWRFTAP